MSILNNSLVLSLSDIIVELFNNKLLADVSFACDNKVIYAHTFLLMSRSIVYEKEFHSNDGLHKVIPIQNYDYESFYQYVRFIYTDKCTITKQNMMTLLKLSIKYKIPKLENMVLAFIVQGKPLTNLDTFCIYVFCVTENYELLHNWSSSNVGALLPDVIQSDTFVNIQPHVMESILKLDFIGTAPKPLKEVDLFKALIKWMNHYCTKNGMALSERLVKFDHLIQLIRFPVMICVCLSLIKGETCAKWNSMMRQVCTIQIQTATKSNNHRAIKNGPDIYFSKARKSRLQNDHYETTHTKQAHRETRMRTNLYESFSGDAKAWDLMNRRPIPVVSNNLKLVNQHKKLCHSFKTTKDLIITGLRIKSCNICGIKVQIIYDVTSILNVTLTPSSSSEAIVSFGEGYLLQPGIQYKIEID